MLAIQENKGRACVLFLICFLLFACLPVKAPEQSNNVGKWVNRYVYEIENPDNSKTLTAYLGVQVFNDSGIWQEMKFEDHYSSEGFYLMANSHITAKIFEWFTIYYDPDNNRVCVDDERWIVEMWHEQTAKWRQVDLYNPILRYRNNDTHITVTRTFDTYEGLFNITYLIKRGSWLKHDVLFKSKISGSQQFRVIMQLTGIAHNKISHINGQEIITSEKHIVTPYFFIGENNKNLIFSEQLLILGVINETSGIWKSTFLKDIVFDVHAKGSKAKIIIGNYTLAETECLFIDPATSTFQVGAVADGALQYGNGVLTTLHASIYFIATVYGNDSTYRVGGDRFSSVTIPENSIINSAFWLCHCRSESYDSMHINIYAHKIADSPNFVDNPNILNETERPRTSNTVEWSQNGMGTGFKKSPDIKDLIQEIINLEGWAYGNALTLLGISHIGFYDTFNTWWGRSYVYGAEYGGQLEINYTPEWENDYVDLDTSDLDATADNGTHSNFEFEKAVDGNFDTLTEENVGGGDTFFSELWVNGFTATETDWTEIGSTPYLDAIDWNSNYIWESADDTHFESRFDFTDSVDLGIIINVEICIYSVQAMGDNGEIEVFIYNATNVYSVAQFTPTNGAWTWDNTTITTILPTWDQINLTQLRVRAERQGGADLLYIDAALIRVDWGFPNYHLDLEIQWINANYTRAFEEVCLLTGAMGAENLEVYVWNITGASWNLIFNDLTASTWNNISVTEWLTGENFTLRLLGAIPSNDITRDTWQIDGALLSTWETEITVSISVAILWVGFCFLLLILLFIFYIAQKKK